MFEALYDYIFLIPPLIIIIFFYFLGKAAIRHAHEVKNTYKKIALELNFNFFEGKDAITSEERASFKGFEQNEVFNKILAALTSWLITGNYQGVQLLIRQVTKGKPINRKTYTNVTGLFPRKLPHGFFIISKNFVTEIFAVGKDIETGFKEIDDNFIIIGKSEFSVKEAFIDSEFRENLINLFELEKNGSVCVKEDSISYEEVGQIEDTQKLQKIIEKISTLITCLGSSDNLKNSYK